MGLTIHYSLKSASRSARQARTLVEQLRQKALDLPLTHVGDIVELSGDECDFQQHHKGDPIRWLLVQSEAHITLADDLYYRVPPRHLIAFETFPGNGCEPANFGLCRYPAYFEVEDDFGEPARIRTGRSGWSWKSFCKTQYASNPDSGGIENFLRCHLSVIKLLDYAQPLGILDEVRDEGNFWETRDMKSLAEEIGTWNSVIAGFAGQMKDLLGNGVQAAITKFPNFEHLEAEGRKDE